VATLDQIASTLERIDARLDRLDARLLVMESNITMIREAYVKWGQRIASLEVEAEKRADRLTPVPEPEVLDVRAIR